MQAAIYSSVLSIAKVQPLALGWQALEAQKASKPLEQGGALEQVGARIERVMGLTNESKPPAEGGSA